VATWKEPIAGLLASLPWRYKAAPAFQGLSPVWKNKQW